MLLTTERGICTSSTSGSNPWLHWAEVDLLPWTSWSLPGLKKHWKGDFDSVREMTSARSGNWTGFTSGTPALRSFIYVDVGEPTRHPCSITGMMQENHLLQLGVTWDIYLRELLCHREEVLSGMRIFFSESVVFHLVFWVSSLLCCFGLCLCLVLFCFDFGRHLAFCFSPVLEQRENSWSKTKRFDDRQSLERARHELKKKLRIAWLCSLFWSKESLQGCSKSSLFLGDHQGREATICLPGQ